MSSGAAAGPAAPPGPLVGAIRWDAWVGDLPTTGAAGQPTAVGLQVERVLGPAHWRDRLPFYARELSDHAVEVRGASQALIDQEIVYAAAAGLDYWAFVWYPPGSGLDTARRLYLASAHRSRIAFCLLFDGLARFRHAIRDRGELLDAFARPEHVRVAGGRPLVFFLARASTAPTATDLAALRREIDATRAAAVAAGVGDPYIACMGSPTRQLVDAIDALGLDAGSAYATPGRGGMPFARLARAAEQCWDGYRDAGVRVLPGVTTGWDPRPLVETPVSWSTWDPDGWAQPGTPDEIAAHLERALAWTARHPAAAEANAVVVYAWNEFAEGGWLCPTLRAGTARLDAIRPVLARRGKVAP
jgi:hypothetical protein